MIDEAIQGYYDRGDERERLLGGGGTLELVRTKDLLKRYLPEPPADVLDVGGGPGVYAGWLAGAGYRVHLVDPVALHVAQAKDAAGEQPDHPFTAAVGDARRLGEADASYDAVLLLGPLYHLTERAERVGALGEARRVLRPGGIVLAAAISRFASLLDALSRAMLDDSEVRQVIDRDVREGQHRNPAPERLPGWFTTAFFHLPEELAAEVEAAGFELEGVLGIEGPGGFVGDWDDAKQRAGIQTAAGWVERERSLLGISPHLLAVGRRGGE